ncbi:MAG: amidohydrolase family protein [Lachnospiraceae bacterium]|nr:amidohydrolase family protein [Lachnospiraceae bacterium]
MEYLLHGDLCFSKDRMRIETMENGYMHIRDGKIVALYETVPANLSSLELKDYRGKIVLPGMVDLHLHAPQYAYRGTKMDLPLLDWLNINTFPEEAKYEDVSYAKAAYTNFVEDLKESPTTRAVIFATLHKEATLELMALLEESGLSTMVGKVNMDRNSPDYLTEHSAEESLENTKAWLREIPKTYRHCRPILTPRFTPTCSDSLLEGLGRLMAEEGLPLQSHLSENKAEIAWVKELCPDTKNYGESYDRYGLLGNTVMAHCVHTEEDELRLLMERGTTIVHCPQSNTNLQSGVAPIKHFLNKGAKVGLGTDVAGGANLSMFRAITDAIHASKLRNCLLEEEDSALTLSEAFYMATLSGGQFFGKVGSFLSGYEADFLVFSGKRKSVREESLLERLEMLLYTERELFRMDAKFVQGRQIL